MKLVENDIIVIYIEKVEAVATVTGTETQDIDGEDCEYVHIDIQYDEWKKVSFALMNDENETEVIKSAVNIFEVKENYGQISVQEGIIKHNS